ncbi:MAG: ABC transporter ATP-binding protein [Clostridia bacterium]|nr:ABC transporter ATP-binding protein [Clostridia bacterium]
MAFLKLANIGKIYVSESNISVGIRGVNLEFERGEFVAVTGESGSGKSTLLNVISGMDTYEEGELYIEGEPTSHYIQADWEEFRQKYVSFIFQDYNIVDSFTVLENVELALMHIENPKERRNRALELLRRVGLEKYLKQRGSKLSGGQKQRTVIARALAKDSPIILADEPTGNLDSVSSREIMELLHEVSRDKLVLVVTHDFGEVEPFATRHIRIYDGGVEYDRILRKYEPVSDGVREKTEKPGLKKTLRQGMTLGSTRFRSMPKLTAFLCILMILAGVGLFVITSFCGELFLENETNDIFQHINGRLVVVRRDGSPITEAECEALAQQTGAENYMRFDYVLDTAEYRGSLNRYVSWQYGYQQDFGLREGRWPVADDEVALRVPVSARRESRGEYDDSDLPILLGSTIELGGLRYTVCGITYTADNTLPLLARFTESGMKLLGYSLYLKSTEISSAILRADLVGKGEDSESRVLDSKSMELNLYNFDIVPGEKKILYWSELDELQAFSGKEKEADGATINYTLDLFGLGRRPDYYGYGAVRPDFSASRSVSVRLDGVERKTVDRYGPSFALSSALLEEIMEDFIKDSYSQSSLFFKNDEQARAAVSKLDRSVYFAVLSNAKQASLDGAMSRLFSVIGNMVLWLGSVAFLILFVSLSSSKAMMATRGDLAIMRSMGIRVPVIRFAVYMQMLFTLIPAAIAVAVLALVLFLTPGLNAAFMFLHPMGYVLIGLGLLLVALAVSKRHVRKLFRDSVKKTIKAGGNA